jgi:hypothetical protein
MEFWGEILEEHMTPGRLWLRLEPETRTKAAEALYTHDWEGEPVVDQANSAIAVALHSREVAVRKMPQEERVRHLARSVRPDGELVSSLLVALHFADRRDVMVAFLDSLKIPHENGLIDSDEEIEPPKPKTLKTAVNKLFKSFPEDRAELYLVTLYMMDPETWAGLLEIMRERVA